VCRLHAIHIRYKRRQEAPSALFPAASFRAMRVYPGAENIFSSPQAQYEVLESRGLSGTFCLSRAALLRAPPAPAGAADGNPDRNRLEPKPTWPPPSPFRGDLAQNGAHTPARAHPAVDKNQGSRVRGAYRGDCG
jgi:hypothetical protein